MKESEAKLLASHGALKEVLVVRSNNGARSTSEESGWVVHINGEPLASARRPTRVFASLDTVYETLFQLGIHDYRIRGQKSVKLGEATAA